MPFYEYVCPACNNKFDLRRVTDERNNPAVCPNCGALAKRKFSVPQGTKVIYDGFDGNDVLHDPEVWK